MVLTMQTKAIIISLLAGMAAGELTGNPDFETAVNVIVLGVAFGLAVSWIAGQIRNREQ